jgi:hypothetical protein
MSRKENARLLDPSEKGRITALEKRYQPLHDSSSEFRDTSDILLRAGWSRAEIVDEWDRLQNDDEAGDYDVP